MLHLRRPQSQRTAKEIQTRTSILQPATPVRMFRSARISTAWAQSPLRLRPEQPPAKQTIRFLEIAFWQSPRTLRSGGNPKPTAKAATSSKSLAVAGALSFVFVTALPGRGNLTNLAAFARLCSVSNPCWIEHQTTNLGVRGSNPLGRANFLKAHLVPRM